MKTSEILFVINGMVFSLMFIIARTIGERGTHLIVELIVLIIALTTHVIILRSIVRELREEWNEE